MNHPQQSRPGPRQWWVLAALLGTAVGASEGVQWWAERRDAAVVREAARAGDIVMYTTSTCPYCAQARRWLDAQQVPWRECNVETDAQCLRVFEAQGAPGVPLIHVKGRWHLGFDAGWLGQALQKKPLP